MKEKRMLLRWCLLLLMATGWLSGTAQGWRNTGQGRSDYRIDRNHVYYRQQQLPDADARTFVDLGYGYAKDYRNVYVEGRVLPYVDPATFRLKGQDGRYDRYDSHYGGSQNNHNGNRNGRDTDEYLAGRYRVTEHTVFYDNMKTEATPRSFVELGGGYAKDAFDVYYCGMKVRDAFANKFVYLGDGYAQDAFNTYYRGRKVE